MMIIKYQKLTVEAMDVYFNYPHRWQEYLKDLSYTGDFWEHQHWYLFYYLPQQWEEEERRSPGSLKDYIREDLFFQNFQLIKLQAQGVEPPKKLVEKVAMMQKKFDEGQQKIFDELKDACEQYNNQRN